MPLILSLLFKSSITSSVLSFFRNERSSHYYASIKCRRTARLLRYVMHCSSENAKNKLYRKVNEKNILKATRARYSLSAPKQSVKERYVQNMKKSIASNACLKQKLLTAFKACCRPLAAKIQPSKLTNAVANIVVRRLLQRVLQI